VYNRNGENRKCKTATEGREENKVGEKTVKRHQSETVQEV